MITYVIYKINVSLKDGSTRCTNFKNLTMVGLTQVGFGLGVLGFKTDFGIRSPRRLLPGPVSWVSSRNQKCTYSVEMNSSIC